jgi:hypothetical protein
LRAADPDGELTEALLAGHAEADRDYLLVAADAVPLVSEQLDTVVTERPHIAPAPDFAYVPSRPEAPLPDLDDLEPISVEEFGAVDGETTAVTTSSVENDVFADLGSMGFEDFSEEPFDPNEAMPAFESSTPAAPLADVVMDDDLSALAAALEGDVADAIVRAGLPPASAEQELEPFDFAMFDQPGASAVQPAATEFSVPGGFEDFSSDEAAFEQAVPPSEAPRGYTTVLRELDDAGLAPFDALNREAPASSTQANHGQQLAPTDAESGSSDIDELTRMNRQWDSIDAEIQNAVPWEVQRGFTDQLRSLEEIGLAPFEFEDEETTGAEPSAPTAASAPTAMEPEAEPVEAEALADAGPAAAPEAEVDTHVDVAAHVEPETQPVAAQTDDADDADLGGLEPFVFEDFEQAEGARAATSQLFGDHGGKSAVPSDADLEALLAIEDEPFLDVEPEPVAQVEAEAELPAATDVELAAADAAQSAEQPAEPDEFEQFLHSTMAATRVLPTDQAPLAEAEPEPAAPVDELATTDSLYERARAAKEQLVADGVITGDREFEAASEPAAAPEEAAEPAQALRVVEDDSPPADDEDYPTLTTGASRDTGTLRAALVADPNDAELHWWLAEALRERGDIGDALGEYRWVIRHAPERHDAVLRALTECVEHGHQPDMAHRLLADIYRRRGDVARASNHAALALQQRQRDTRR